jgi:uncharacterized protein (TIGR00369 family)
MPALTLTGAQDLFEANFALWVQDLRLAVEAVSDTGARLRMPFDQRLVRVGGAVCGQALMALADTAMVFAISAASGGFRPMTTVGQTMSFLRPAANADVLAEARLLKLGRTLAFGEVTLTVAGRADAVAHATSTYALIG